MPYCTNCGSRVQEDASFCGSCGHPRSAVSQQRVETLVPPPQAAPAQPARYIPVTGRRTALVWLLGISIGLSVVALASDLIETELLGRIASGGDRTFSEVDASDMRQSAIGIVQFLLFLTTGILWLSWFWRAYKNLPALGARNLRFSSGWAIGAWFVPFLNLVRPKAMTDDTWRASDPEAPPIQEEPLKGKRVSPVLHWWWALFLISSFLGRFVLQGSLRQETETLEGIQALNALTVASDLLDIPLAILAISVVRQITHRQQARAQALSV